MVLKDSLLKEPKSFLGAKRLLFHRLIDDAPHEPFEKSEDALLDKEGLKESIQLELTRLLNTRSNKFVGYQSGDEEKRKISGVLAYGLPDFSVHDPANMQDWYLIGESIQGAIDFFEPRLQNVKVDVQKFDEKNQILYVKIQGILNVKKIEGEVTFDITVECSGEK
jgi:type VI secretion system lysozyme-like protein